MTDSIVTWQSENTPVATIDNNGLATTLTEGTANITATYRTLISNPIPLTINPPDLTKITISPANASTSVFDVTGFTAYGSFSNNTGRDMTNEVTWSSGGGTIIEPLSQYLATYPTLSSVYSTYMYDYSKKYYIGLSNGTATISAASGTISVTANIAVGCNMHFVSYSENAYPDTAYDTYFNKKGAPYTIGTSAAGYGKGCMLSAYAMVFATRGLTINGELVNPVNLNQWLIDNGGYSPAGGYIDSYGIIAQFPGAPSSRLDTTSLADLDAALTNCRPAIVGVNSYFSGSNHFVLVTRKIGNDYEIIDPYSFRSTKLSDYIVTNKFSNHISEVISF